jgi:hypothetical protein
MSVAVVILTHLSERGSCPAEWALITDIHDKYLSRETEVPLEAARGFWLPLVF